MREWSWLISKANHSTSQSSKTMPNHWCWRNWSWPMKFCEDLQDLLELTPKKKKKCPFHHRGLECRSRKTRDTWNNRQVWPWSTKWKRTKANRILSREHASHRNTFSNNPRDSSTHGYHQMVNTEIRFIIFFAAEDKEALCSKNKTWSWLWLRSLAPYCKIQA